MINRQIYTITNAIIILTIFMFLIQNSIPQGTIRLGLNHYFLDANLWYQPLSTMFVHGSIMHLLMNMFVLYQFGNLIEIYRGKSVFLLLYFVGGIATSLLSFVFIDFFDLFHNLVGASGAICVLMGYIAYVDRAQRQGIVIWILLISFAPLLIGMPIAWYAHIIGFILGFVFGIIKRY